MVLALGTLLVSLIPHSLLFIGVMDLFCWIERGINFHFRLYHSSKSVHASSQFLLHNGRLTPGQTGRLIVGRKLTHSHGPPGWWSLRWDSKIWPWVLRDFDSRVTALARPRSNCTANYRPVLSSERALQNNKYATVWRKFQGERKTGCGSQMGAWHQDRLADWLSVVN
jgi:hypothetical protein